MINYAIEAASTLRTSSTNETFRYVRALVLLLIGLAIASMLIGAFFSIPPAVFGWVLMSIVLCSGVLIGGALAIGFFHGQGQENRVVKVAEKIAQAEIEAKKPAPPALPLPTLPPAPTNDDIHVTRNGRGGENIPRDLINGFDPRALKYFAIYLANGNKFTEGAMEKLPLPYGEADERMGKAEGNSPYNRLMALCVSRGIIEGRGGPGNPPGKLVVTDANEILARLRKLD